MRYYIIIDNQSSGPFTIEELAAKSVLADTLVWRTGMEKWQPASSLPELAGIIVATPPPVDTCPPSGNPLWRAMLNGREIGPATAAELVAAGVNSQTDVWCPGMDSWQPAHTCPEMAEAIRMAAADTYTNGPRPAAPGYPTYTAGQQMPPQIPTPIPHQSWTTASIIATILGFLCSCIGGIFGIIGIVYATKADNAFNTGNAVAGEAANSTAKLMTIISFVLTGAGIILSALYCIFVGFATLGTL